MSSQKKGLGKGFDVLVPAGFDVQLVAAAPEERIHKLAIDIVKPKADQPRQHFDESALNDLVNSIREHGILQPIVVVETEQNMYAIIAGERRWRAAKKLGLQEVPVVVRSADALQQVELALLENIQREDLSPLETAATILRLHDEFNQSYEQIAKRLGKAQTTVSNIVRLLSLPIPMQQALQAGQISEGHARALLSLAKQQKDQQVLFEQIIRHGWNVRQAESFAAAAKKAGKTTSRSKQEPKTLKSDVALQKQLGDYLGAKVSLRHTAKGGKIIIGFTSDAELERIVDQVWRSQKS